MITFSEFITENAFNQLGQKKPVGDILPAPAKGSVPKHGKKFKEGDIVVPHAGPHAGVKHKVVVARAGSVNMIPLGLPAREDKYNSATVRAKHEHLSPYTKPVAEESELEEKRGLWDNIHAKQERIKRGSKERMRKPGSEGAPTKQDFVNSQTEEVAAWQRKEGKNPEGGLNKAGVMSYRRENPGSKLQTAVTTKPSKLKKGSKAANRRKSFCARMSGMKKRLTSSKTANDPNSRINKSLRKWNC